ncbi:hypothetical protein Vretimale_11912 [Volvox reticuliferus]|uniref:Nucleolus and neural progenitor protein-like N-terminal domain-containing protein n=1 Tax=Volvox reticuliferus TaxID=1737510 RepID=A0A8J4GJ42_9CHLO|nr:hypothetical protein Vretifemale_11448 [Volvox reticuliferus]GIM07853.1 hypothetical protein Vretimale_11912 [Volvox reticuliferus]
MSALGAADGRVWALPGHLRRTIQVSCYGDLASQFRQANIPVLKACLHANSFWSEVAILDRLVYKNTSQHRGAHLMRYLKEVRRTLTLLRELQLEGLVDDLHCMLQMGGVVPKASASTPAMAATAAAGTTWGGKDTTRGANAAGGGDSGGGRTSYRLPCRETAAAILKQIIAGCALIMGLQSPLQLVAAHLSAQLALTFFVPMCMIGCAVLARIKVLSLQLLLDCVKAYNAIADLLPLLPSSTAAWPAGDDAALLLQPALASALQPPTVKASTAVATASMVSEPRALPRTSRAVAGMQQQQQQQLQAPPQEEIRSRSLRQMLQRGPMPSEELLQPAAAIRANNSAAAGPMASVQPAAVPAAAAAGPPSQRLPAAAGLQRLVAPIPLPQMVRCRWDEHVHLAYLEPVSSGGPDQPEPTWQGRAAKAAERHGYMIAVQLDPQVEVAELDAVAAVAGPSSEAKRPPRSLVATGPRAVRAQTAGGAGTAATANSMAAQEVRSDVGVRVDRRSFFDLIGSKRPSGLSALQPAAGGKRSHAAQAMAPLQVIDDRVAKRQKGPNGANTAALAGNVSVDGATAKNGGSAAAAAAAVATTVLAPAATATVAPLPQPAAAGPSVPDSPVVMSYTTRQGFVLGLGNTKPGSGDKSTGGGQAAAAAQLITASGPIPEPTRTTAKDTAPADRPGDSWNDGATANDGASGALQQAGVPIAGMPTRLTLTNAAPSLVPSTRGSMARPPRSGAKPAFLAVPPSNPSSRAGIATAAGTATAGGGGDVVLPGAAVAAVPQFISNSGGSDGGRLALTHGSVGIDGSAAAEDDPLLGIILQGHGGERGRGRGASGSGSSSKIGSSCTRPGFHSAIKAPRASSGAAAAATGGGNGGSGSLAASLDLLLGGLPAAPGEGVTGAMHPGGTAGNGGGGAGGSRGGSIAGRGGRLDPGRGSIGARGRSSGQTPKWR